MSGYIPYATLAEVWGDDLTGKKKKKSNKNMDAICDLYNMKESSSAYSETDLVNYTYDKNKTQRTLKDIPHEKYNMIDNEHEIYESKKVPNSLFENQFSLKHPQSFEMDDPKEYMVRSCKLDDDSNYPNEDIITKPKLYHDYDEQQQQHQRQHKILQESYYSDTDNDDETIPRKHVRQERGLRQERGVRQERKKEYFYETDDEDEYKPKQKQGKRGSLVYLDIILYILSGIILIFLLEQFVRIGINMQHI